MSQLASVEAAVPRIIIRFCIQCKWNLRAAYYAQELLQTFSTSLGEVALRPATGGIFTVTLETRDEQSSTVESHLLWDRKRDNGFPETKELKKKVRDIIDPQRDLGHVDGKKQSQPVPDPAPEVLQMVPQLENDAKDGDTPQPAACEDCR